MCNPPTFARQKLGNGSVKSLPRQRIHTLQYKNCWTRRFICGPCLSKEIKWLVLPRTSCLMVNFLYKTWLRRTFSFLLEISFWLWPVTLKLAPKGSRVCLGLNMRPFSYTVLSCVYKLGDWASPRTRNLSKWQKGSVSFEFILHGIMISVKTDKYIKMRK
jgi:hypothetical protein